MKTLKKLLCAALALSLTLALTACGGQDPAASASGSGEGTVYRIGISQYGEHPSLDNCRTGFLQGLEEAGPRRAWTSPWITRTPTSTTPLPPRSPGAFPRAAWI